MLRRKAFLLVSLLGLVACAPQVTTQTSGGLSQEQESKYANYDGPRAKVVVAPFSCKAEKCGSGPDKDQVGAAIVGKIFGLEIPLSSNDSIGSNISDLLMTALINTNHFIVYDRSILEQIQKEAQLGQSGLRLEGADILITGSVTAFEPDAGGSKGGGIIGSLPLIGGLVGSEKKAYVAVDIRMVDAKTGALIGAFRVEGEASDTNFGGLGGVLPAGALGGALGQYQKTPMGKALAVMVASAVDEIIKRIPKKYFRYTEDGQLYQIQDSSSEGSR